MTLPSSPMDTPRAAQPDPTPSDTLEIKAAIDRVGATYEALRQTHEEADTEEALLGRVDALLEEKTSRLNGELDRLGAQVRQMRAALARPGRTTDASEEGGDLAYKSAFYDGYVRRGRSEGLELKALRGNSDADGGYAVPEVLDTAIEKRLRDRSPLRQLASVVRVGTSRYAKLVAISGAQTGWVSETAARPETTSPTFAEVRPTPGEIYANPAATQAMLDDAFFDVESWLAEELADAFAAEEGAAFVNGSGTNRPRGFLAGPTALTPDATRPFGTLQMVKTGLAAKFPATNPGDVLIDLVHSLRADYRREAAFLMNSTTLAVVRKFRDADGNYLWRPGLVEGASATLLGYPVVEADHMPDMAADSLSVAFGNFQRGYLIADRQETRVLRDPYSNKPYVHFYATRRVGGAVVNSDAIKLLAFSA